MGNGTRSRASGTGEQKLGSGCLPSLSEAHAGPAPGCAGVSTPLLLLGPPGLGSCPPTVVFMGKALTLSASVLSSLE